MLIISTNSRNSAERQSIRLLGQRAVVGLALELVAGVQLSVKRGSIFIAASMNARPLATAAGRGANQQAC